MQIVRHAKYVGTMVGPDGHFHRWTAYRKQIIQRVLKINASTKSLGERLCDIKIYAISVLSFIGSACAPDKATLKAENHALQCFTAGPYNAIPSTLLGVGSICGLGPDLVGIHSISLAARYRFAACSTTLSQGLGKINTARGHKCTHLFALSLSLPSGNMSFFFLPWPSTQRVHLTLFVAWTVMTRFMMCLKTKNRKLLRGCFKTNFINKTWLVLSLAVPREFQDRSVVIVLLTSCLA